MTELLTKALAEVSKLPDEEQDHIAALILAEIDSERRWDELFAKSEDLLTKLANEALTDFRNGNTEILDPDKL
jgi:hypothetical protein